MHDSDFDDIFAQIIKDAPRLSNSEEAWTSVAKKLDGNIQKMQWIRRLSYGLPMLALLLGNAYFFRRNQQLTQALTSQQAVNQILVLDTVYQYYTVNIYDTPQVSVSKTPQHGEVNHVKSSLSEQAFAGKTTVVADDNLGINSANITAISHQNEPDLTSANTPKSQKSGNNIASENIENNAALNRNGIEFLENNIKFLPIEQATFAALSSFDVALPTRVSNRPKMPNMVLSANVATMPFLRKSIGNSCGIVADIEVRKHLFVTASADFQKYIADLPSKLDDSKPHGPNNGDDDTDGHNHPNSPDTTFRYKDSRLPEFRQQTYGLGLKYVIPTGTKLRPFVAITANLIRTPAHQIEYRYRSHQHHGGPNGQPHRTEFINEEIPASKPRLNYATATTGLTYMLSNRVGLNGSVSYRQQLQSSANRTDFNSLSLSTGLSFWF